jgi:hypothetical protein
MIRACGAKRGDDKPLWVMTEQFLPSANLARGALHPRLENPVGQIAQVVQGGSHGGDPCYR